VIDWNFSPGAPDLSAFPRGAWITATRRAVTSCPSDVFGHSDPRGIPVLRRALAGYLGRARGVLTSPEQIVICSGYIHALSLLASVLAASGSTHIAFEDHPCRCTGRWCHMPVSACAVCQWTATASRSTGSVRQWWW
jgi:GntR family transcriptional regulator/MocR family aminotransferase